jgi:hypothetical protein
MKNIILISFLTVSVIIISVADANAQVDKTPKINPKAIYNPKKIVIKPTKLVAAAFFEYFGREPNSDEAIYWNSISKKKTYTQIELRNLIKLKFIEPKDITAEEAEVYKKEARSIILRAYQKAEKPTPTENDVENRMLNLYQGIAWYQTILNQLGNK